MNSSHKLLELGLVIGLAAVCCCADYFLKKASQLPSPFSSAPFWIGLVIYSLSAFGWVMALRWFKLSTIGAVYSVVLIVLLALIGVTVFSEKINGLEILGLLLACASIVILTRFS